MILVLWTKYTRLTAAPPKSLRQTSVGALFYDARALQGLERINN